MEGEKNQNNAGENEGEETGEKLLAGKFKTPEEMEQGYTNLEQKLGEQGEEVSTLRKQTQYLTEQLESGKQAAQEEGGQAGEDYNAKLQDIQNQIEEGELSVSEGLAKTSEITAAMATDQAMTKFHETQQQQAVEASKQKFAEDNPDFFELQKQGELEKVKSQYPGLHDDFSAYFQLKANQEAQAAYERGKQEMAKIAEGDKGTQKVLPGEGSDPQMQEIGDNKKPAGESDMKESMLNKLKSYRKGG